MLLVAAVIAAVVAWQQRREAIAQRDLAIQTSSLSQLRNNLNSGSLLGAAQVGWSGYRRFGPRPLVLQGLYEFTSHPMAVIQTLPEPTGARTRVTLSPRDDQVLSLTSNAANSYDATLRDWHGIIVDQRLQVADAHFSRDGATLVVGCPDAPGYMFNEDGSGCGNEAANGIAVSARSFALRADGTVGAETRMPGLGSPVYAADGSAALTICGNSVYLAGADGVTLGILSVEGASSAGFSPDGGSILVAGIDGTVLFDRAGRQLGRFPGKKPVFTSDGNRIVTEVSDRQSVLWEVSGEEVRRLRGANPQPGGGGSVLTGANGASLLWLADESDAIGLAGTQPKVSADSEWILTTAGDRTLIWDRSGNKLTELDGVSGQFVRRAGLVVTTDPVDGTRLWDLSRLSLVSKTAAARLWGIEPGELEEGRFSNHNCLPDCVSPDGAVRLMVGASGATPGLPMRFSVVPISNEPGSADTVPTASEGNAATECPGLNTLAFAPSGRGRYLVGCGDGNLYVHGPDGTLLRHWRQPSSVNTAVFSADGDRVLSGLDGRVAILASVTTGEEVGRFPGHDGAVTGVAFSPAGDQVATVSSGGILRLWRRSGALLGTFAIPGTRIEGVAFAPDGRHLLSRNSDGSLRRRTIDLDRLLEDYAWLATLPSPVASDRQPQ